LIPLFFLIAILLWIFSLLTNISLDIVTSNFLDSVYGVYFINFFKNWPSSIRWFGGMILIVFPTIAWLVLLIFKFDLDKIEEKFAPIYFKIITILNILILTIIIILNKNTTILIKIWQFLGMSIFFYIVYSIGNNFYKISEEIEDLKN